MASNGDFILKLERASSHLNDLETQIGNWLNPEHYTGRTQRDHDRPEYLHLFATVEDIPRDPFALLIGDTLHNLRGALDHLAYAIAAKHAKPFTEEIAETSEFPIFGDKRGEGITATEKRHEKAFAKMLNGIPPDAQTIIKSLQPYHRGKDYINHPLWILRDLSNKDKHRLLLIAAWIVTGTMSHHKTGFIPGVKVKVGFMTGETEVALIKITPEDEMDMNFAPILDIAFRCGGPANGKSVRDILKLIHNFIGTRVFGLLGKFL